MMYCLSIFSDIGFAIWQAIRSLIGIIAGALYGYIVDLYNVFMIIARADILDDKYIQLIYNRVGMLLGLFMLFKLSFSLIQSLINPDKFTDKKNGFSSIIYRSIISIVLLGITPSIFKFAFNFQNFVVGTENNTNNVLYRVIVADDVVNTSSSFGRRLATDLFFSFFREKNGVDYVVGISINDNEGQESIRIDDYDDLKRKVENGEIEFSDLVPYLSLRDSGQYVFQWDIILSVGVAIGVLWILISYCISVAIRIIQLAYLQLISPIPILSYIGNPDGAFKNWVKQCTATYLDLFLRLIILYFIITVADKVLQIVNSASFLATYKLDEESGQYILVKVFLILGLLLFGKRVPDLLKELFPGNSKFDLGIKSPKKLLSEIPGLNSAIGVGSGVALGAAGAAVGGLAHGLVNMKKNWQDNKGQGIKRAGKTFGAGLKGVGSSAIHGVTGGLKGVSNVKGGLGGAFKMGMKNLNTPLKGDIESWKEHKKYWIDDYNNSKEINEGRKMYDRYGEDNLADAFGSREYAMTYRAKKAAGDAKDKATAALEAARSELNAAYNTGDQTKIAAANNKYLATQKAYDSAVKAYERSEEAHKLSQSKYEGDFKREEMFKKFKNSESYNTLNERTVNPDDVIRQEAFDIFKNSDEYKSLIEQRNTSPDELLRKFKSTPEYIDYVNNVSNGTVYEKFRNSDSYRDLENENKTNLDNLFANFDAPAETLTSVNIDLLNVRDAFKRSDTYVSMMNNNADESQIFEAFKNSAEYKKYLGEKINDAYVSSDEYKEFVDNIDLEGKAFYDSMFYSGTNADNIDVSQGRSTVFGKEALPPVDYNGTHVTPGMSNFADIPVDIDGTIHQLNNGGDHQTENNSQSAQDMSINNAGQSNRLNYAIETIRRSTAMDKVSAINYLKDADPSLTDKQAEKLLKKIVKK